MLLWLYALVGGVLSLAGWVADVPRLTDWLHTGISIQPNTAVAATLSGLALMLLARGHRRAPVALAVVPILAGVSSSFQMITGIGLDGLNTALMFGRTWGRTATLEAGLMGPPAATCWTLIGIALVLAARGVSVQARRAVPAIAIFTSAIATLSIAGYMYGAGPLYSLPNATAISLQTATFVAAVSLGLMAAIPEHAPMRWLLDSGASGVIARRAIPFVIVVPFVIGWVRLLMETAGLYEVRFGVALLVVALIASLLAVLAWVLRTVAVHEAALRQSEQRLTETLASITDGFVILDEEWRYAFVNDEAARLMGRRSERLIGRRVWDVFSGAVGGAAYESLQRAATERVRVEFDMFHTATQRWFNSKAYPKQDGGLAVYFEDITERKEIAQQLSADFAALTRVQALATQLVPTGDRNALLQEILAVAAELTGTDMGMIQSCDPDTGHLRIVVHQGLEQPFLEHFAVLGYGAGPRVMVDDITQEPSLQGTADLKVVLAAGVRAVQSTPLVSRDGRQLGMLNTLFAMPHRPDERQLGYLDLLARMAADVVERAAAEMALRTADRRKDEFLATLAHELRGPLAPVMNSLELLDQAGGDAAVVRRARDILQRQLSHMVRLVDDLLDVGRISRDKLELRKQRVELQAVVAHAVEGCNPLVRSFGHELVVALPPEPVFVEADEARLTQIVGNLLNNACKYTPSPGRIALAATRDGGDVVLRVTDSGIGIPNEQLASVFDLFSQLGRSVEQQHGGLGIGLYLVKRLVELHGGSVDVHSDGAGHGSEFIVRLPRLPETAASAQPAEALRAPRAPARRFLVVDDNVDTATSLELLLAIHGHETRIAHDGADALAAADGWHPDVVLLDIGLPQMSGYEVCRRMRERPWGKRTVIVALTGWGQERDRRQSQDAGFDLHLVKPVTFASLMDLLGEHTADGRPGNGPRSPVVEQAVHGNAAHRDVQP